MPRTGSAEPLHPSPSDDSPPLNGRRVLVVDDDGDSREWLRVCLESERYRVLTASSGMEALEQVARHRPDLVLMDVLMPVMDGFEATRRLKQYRGTRDVPVVMVTRLNDRDARLRGLDAGAEDFLSKPIDPVELTVRVRNLLRMKLSGDILRQRNRTLEREVLYKTREARQHCIDTVLTLTRAAEYRDEQTGNHVSRISYYCVELAEQMGLDDGFREQIFYASPMHDIGKLAIPDHILLKQGPLSPDEWEVMKRHARLGRDILEGHRSPYLEMGKDIALCHHECWDGSGYPQGLAGEDIPLADRKSVV